MYHDTLDSPPPRSQFPPTTSHGQYQYTRPWSPDPYDPLQTPPGSGMTNESRDTFNRLQRGHHSPRQGNNGDQPFPGDYAPEYPALPPDQFPVLHSKFKREASDISVEALDLADYARTLRVRQAEDPYPAFPFADSSLNSLTANHTRRQVHRESVRYTPPHPPSSFPAFPVPATGITRGGTFSSANTSTATHQTPRGIAPVPTPNNRTYGRQSHRPFSLPSSPYGSTPHLAIRPPDPENEIDISQFPAWSRNWYTNNTNSSRRTHPPADVDSLEAYELEAGLALPRPLLGGDSSSKRGPPSSSSNHNNNPMPSGSNRQPLSPFDPAYIHPQSYPRRGGDMFNDDDYPSYSAPSYTNHDPLLGDLSREGIVPWSHDPPEYGQAPLDPQVKETRMRMLEKAFGTPTDSKKGLRGGGGGGGKESWKAKGKRKEVDDGLLRDETGRMVVGTPDGKGGLATQNPYVRVALRISQVLLVVAVGGPVFWAAVALKPNPVPPPAGKPPLYILYVLSPITFILLLYLFVVRPCTVRRRFSSSSPFTHPAAAAHGMMVVPVHTGAGGGKNGKKKGGKGGMFPGQKGKKGRKGAPMAGPGDVQVNLIVDPNAFGLPGDDSLSSCSEEDINELMFDDGEMPGAFLPNYPQHNNHNNNNNNGERQKAKRKKQRRRTLAASLRLEEEWKLARGWMRKMAFADAGVFLVWGVAFGFVIAGKRCPTGGQEKGYGGWCTAYNASTAASCLLCVTFAVSLFFGVKDLYASKLSPRTRM